jgi:hypothetical protein
MDCVISADNQLVNVCSVSCQYQGRTSFVLPRGRAVQRVRESCFSVWYVESERELLAEHWHTEHCVKKGKISILNIA